ncbi:hypothetical protein KCU73_g4625, partial [Aureobasidium melanogenum]
MSIQDLPDELLLHIFKPFDNIQRYDDSFVSSNFVSANIPSAKTSENIKSLASFSKVCVRWHRVIEPILYSTFTKPNNTGVKVHRQVYKPGYQAEPNKTLRLFLRTIIEQPRLAKNITKLLLGSWIETARQQVSQNPSVKIAPSAPDPSIRQTYVKALERLGRFTGSSARSRYIRSDNLWSGSNSCILGGDEGSELALLLLLAPNLRVLRLTQMPIFEEWMLPGVDGMTQTLSHLHKIELGTVYDSLEVYDHRLRMLMNLPSLETLTVINCHVLGCAHFGHPPSALTSLAFRYCTMDSRGFEHLTNHLRAIESFEWTGMPQWPFNWRWAPPDGVWTFLTRHKASLQSLRLTGEMYFDEMGPVTFKEFKSVEELEINHTLLIHGDDLADQLPQSLRRFGIEGSPFPMLNKLVTLVNSRALQNLEKIDYGPVGFPANEQETTGLQKLEDICAREGVVLRNAWNDEHE